MSYCEIYKDKNIETAERFVLVMERIAEIETEKAAEEPYADYFQTVSHFILLNKEVLEQEESGALEKRSLAEC